MTRITNFYAQNFQIINVVEISPEGNVVTIGGDNGQGKSSILKAIWVALVGRSVAGPTPIRKGEEVCTIRVATEDFLITRKFTRKEGGDFTDTLKVESPDGRTKFNKPQQVIDAVLGNIGFDPFAFTLKKPEQQAETLLEMVPLAIDIDELAEADVADIAKRRDINRDAAGFKAQIDAIEIDEDLPDAPIDRDAILGKLSSAADTNSAIDRERRDREDTARVAQGRRDHAAELRLTAEQHLKEAERLTAEAVRLRQSAEADDEDAVRLDGELADKPALDEPVDTAKLRTDLATAESTNAKIERAAQRKALVAKHDKLVGDAQALTDMIDAREQDRRKALSAAKMPIAGLGFAINEKGKPVVMFNDLPFEVASSADQIRASTAIAIAANPDLRVMRIKDGSLLDSKSLAIITGMAEEADWQVWIERVGDGGVGFVIENGEIKAPEEPKGEGKLL